jgi:hypothetical protein
MRLAMQALPRAWYAHTTESIYEPSTYGHNLIFGNGDDVQIHMRRIGWAKPCHTLPAERPTSHLLLGNLPVTLFGAVFDKKKFLAQPLCAQ